MADVSYVDSAGERIMCALRRIRSMGGLMSLTNVSQPVFRGLSCMRLVDFMPVARVGRVSILLRWILGAPALADNLSGDPTALHGSHEA